MPHVSGGGDGGSVDLSSNDEIKVFQLEGEGEDVERSSSENLKEVKNSLVAEVPEEEDKHIERSTRTYSVLKNSHPAVQSFNILAAKRFDYVPPAQFGYVVSPYHHPNGISMINRMRGVPPNVPQPVPFMMYSPETFQPPPAHMGISPVHVDPKSGLARSPVFPVSSSSQYHPVFSPEFVSHFPWSHSSMLPVASGFRSPTYPGPLPLSPASMSNKFSPTLVPPHTVFSPGLSHHPLLGPGPKIEMPDHQDSRYLCNFSSSHLPNFNHHQSNNSHSVNNNTSTSQPLHHPNIPQNSNNMGDNSSARARSEQKKKNHIKKPLNAFMLYMKEKRAQVVAECTLKESAAINQILGRKWHGLTREEQAIYYEMARKERQLHMKLYPGWTARDNYAINAKKKKRKRDKSQEGDGNNPKKCRARYGLDQQDRWCKPCRRKKKCIRYCSGSDNVAEIEDNIGSVGSLGSEAPTPDSRFGMDSSQLTDEDSGNGDIDDEISSEFSLSSPPVQPLSPQVPRPLDNVQSVLENGSSPMGKPPSHHMHHPLNVQHLSKSSGHHPPSDSPEGNLPQLPTPPSTDSSTTTTVGIAVT